MTILEMANAAPLEDEAGRRAVSRWMKLAVTAVCMVVLALGLCSCNYLDELKQRRLDYVYEPGTYTIVSLTGQGHTYTRIVDNTQLGFFYSSNWVYVTQEDVPLLLVPEFGYSVPASEDGRLVKVGGALYASDEMTVAEIEAVKKVKLDRYVMQVWDEQNGWMGWAPLDDDITAAIQATLKGYAYNGMPSESDIPAAGWKSYDTTDTFIAVDADMVFMGADYQFSIYDTGQIFLMDWYEYAFYVVPEEYHAVVMDFYRNGYTKGDGVAPMPIAVPER